MDVIRVIVEEPVSCGAALLGGSVLAVGCCCFGFVMIQCAGNQVAEYADIVKRFFERNGIDLGSPAAMIGFGVCALAVVAALGVLVVLVVRRRKARRQ